MQTIDVINKYYDAANLGDWDTWLSLFDDNVIIDEQIAGHLQGIETLRGAIGGIERGYSKFQNLPQQIVVNGKEACVVSHISAANASGVSIEANVANYFRLKNGKITYMANFHDTRPFDPFVNQSFD
jgi:ketosteroid isomerase-like protein